MHEYCPEVHLQCMNIFRVYPVLDEYSQSPSPLLAQICNYELNFICNLIPAEMDPKPCQKEVGHCLDWMNPDYNCDDISLVKSTSWTNFYSDLTS